MQSCPYRCWGKAPGRWSMASAWGRWCRRARRALAWDTRPALFSRCRTGSCRPFAPSRDRLSWAFRSRSNRARWHHPRGSWRHRCPRVLPPSSWSPSTKVKGRLGSRHPLTTSPATSPWWAVRRSPGSEIKKSQGRFSVTSAWKIAICERSGKISRTCTPVMTHDFSQTSMPTLQRDGDLVEF